MAVTQVGSILVQVAAKLKDTLDLSTVVDDLLRKYSIPLAAGAGADQANQVFHDQRTLAASATEDLDLAASLVNPVGDTITFARVKAIIVFASEGNTNNVQMSVPAANGFSTWALAASDGLTIRPGGIVALVAPDATAFVVTAGTGDLLTFTNAAAGSGVTYDVILIGVAA